MIEIAIPLIFGLTYLVFFYWLLKPTTKKEHDKAVEEEPIKNETIMQIHCKNVSEDGDFYWATGLWCATCVYSEDCVKYVKKYGRLPNGEKVWYKEKQK